MFRALKFLKRPVIMVRFPGDRMSFLAPDSPGTAWSAWSNIVGWFDKYLQGMAKPEYDDVATGEVGMKPADLPGNMIPGKPAEPATPPKPKNN